MSFLFSCCRKGTGKGQYYELLSHDTDGKVKHEFVENLTNTKDLEQADRVLRLQKSDYDELIKQYTGDKKWSDPEFPPNSSSLGKIENVPSDC